MEIRALVPADLEEICGLARETLVQPWSRRQFKEELGVHSGIRLAARGGELLGFALFRQALDEAELLLLAVAEGHRRQGVGSSLLYRGHEIVRNRGAVCCYLEVRRRNRGARLFYEAMGYRSLGLRHRYYHRPDDDAVVMKRRLRREDENSQGA